MMPILSLVVVSMVILGLIFAVKSGGGLALFFQNKGQNKRIDALEKQYGVLLDLVLYSDIIDATEFTKKLLQAKTRK